MVLLDIQYVVISDIKVSALSLVEGDALRSKYGNLSEGTETTGIGLVDYILITPEARWPRFLRQMPSMGIW